ncbi:MAG TPA: hypothetical protein VHB53_07960 [Solirubrobacterales bacterium]|nr:hypothetical protein [Solirubrobacterales bacterium]
MPADLEKLAYESALRALDKQERLVEELRARTGLVLAASSVAASLLGGRGVGAPGPNGFALLAIACLVASIGAAVFVLLPREDLMFSVRGIPLFEGLSDSTDLAESFLRAATSLDGVWATNEVTIQLLTRAFSVAAVALAIEIGALAVFMGGTLI